MPDNRSQSTRNRRPSLFNALAFPEYWLFFLGLLFILVTLFMPRGVIGLLSAARWRRT